MEVVVEYLGDFFIVYQKVVVSGFQSSGLDNRENWIGFRVELIRFVGGLDVMRERRVRDDIWVFSLSNWGYECYYLFKKVFGGGEQDRVGSEVFLGTFVLFEMYISYLDGNVQQVVGYVSLDSSGVIWFRDGNVGVIGMQTFGIVGEGRYLGVVRVKCFVIIFNFCCWVQIFEWGQQY